MNRRISLAAISLCIGACASSGPEVPSEAVTEPPAVSDAVASDTTSAPPEGEIYDLDVPAVEMSAAPASSDPDEIVCRRETPTGSRMSVRVCRTRAEIDERAARDQEIMRQSRSKRSGGDCALNGNC